MVSLAKYHIILYSPFHFKRSVFRLLCGTSESPTSRLLHFGARWSENEGDVSRGAAAKAASQVTKMAAERERGGERLPPGDAGAGLSHVGAGRSKTSRDFTMPLAMPFRKDQLFISGISLLILSDRWLPRPQKAELQIRGD